MTLSAIDAIHDVLLVVDVQNDFCPGGALAVPQGHDVVPVINALACVFPNVVLTQDWHPAGHSSFASSHPDKAPFDSIVTPDGPQVLWPDHCVQNSPGADLHPALFIPHVQMLLRKGTHKHIDSYSAFLENDRRTRTGLSGYLRDRDVHRVFIAGLAYDFCVRWSALDARHEGLEVVVIEDACQAINLAGSADQARAEMIAAGVTLVQSDDVFGVAPI